MVCVLALWTLVDGRYDQALDFWLRKYPSLEWIERWPKLSEQMHEAMRGYVCARWGALAVGAVSGLGLLGWTAGRWFQCKKPKDTLADPQK